MSRYLIAGLGNPGSEYEGTRHNIGFDIVDRFVSAHEGAFETDRLASVAHVRLKGRQVVCIKPSTFMNLSGRSVKYWLDREGVEVGNLLVVMDELSIPLSRLRLNAKGSDGGHNGLKSIQEALQSQLYARLRFGIGNGYPKGGQVDFVLGRWREEEKPIVERKTVASVAAVEAFILSGVQRAMNATNNLDFTP